MFLIECGGFFEQSMSEAFCKIIHCLKAVVLMEASAYNEHLEFHALYSFYRLHIY